MKGFLEMNIMMSYRVLPEIHDCFSNEPDLRVPPIAETMPREILINTKSTEFRK